MEEKYIIYGLFIALVMASILSLFASPDPDGLERVAEDHGFMKAGEGHEVIKSPMPDYIIPGIDNETLAASLAGFIGTIMMFGIGIGIGKVFKRR